MTAGATLDWYFDYVSAFAYFQFERLGELPAGVTVRFRPVLFAGLLGHHGHKGPAEIPEKRRFTYRHWVWLSKRYGIPFRMPEAHPFNPLPALRLCYALDCDPEAIGGVFRWIWGEGRGIHTPEGWRGLVERLGITDAEARIQDPAVKEALRRETEEATRRGVFGVPTFMAGETLFWGLDAMDMLCAYLDDPAFFSVGEMARVSDLPMAAVRKL